MRGYVYVLQLQVALFCALSVTLLIPIAANSAIRFATVLFIVIIPAILLQCYIVNRMKLLHKEIVNETSAEMQVHAQV